MDSNASAEITKLLHRASSGDRLATEALIPLVYDELRELAAKHLAAERSGHTLQPTALVNEAYLRLVSPSSPDWESRAHFFGAASRAIRRVLVDHARARDAAKRSDGRKRVAAEHAEQVAAEKTPDYIAISEALDRLAQLDPPKARMVELRFFGGLSVAEVARVTGVSERTVARDWKFARAWLANELGDDGGEQLAAGEGDV